MCLLSWHALLKRHALHPGGCLMPVWSSCHSSSGCSWFVSGWCKSAMTRKRETFSIKGALSSKLYCFSLSLTLPRVQTSLQPVNEKWLWSSQEEEARWCLYLSPSYSFPGSRQPFILKAYDQGSNTKQKRPPSWWLLRRSSWCLCSSSWAYSFHIPCST